MQGVLFNDVYVFFAILLIFPVTIAQNHPLFDLHLNESLRLLYHLFVLILNKIKEIEPVLKFLSRISVMGAKVSFERPMHLVERYRREGVWKKRGKGDIPKRICRAAKKK